MIYDCFLYYNEDMLLDIRLHTLNNVIDKFVIVESTYTFTGLPKPLNFNIDKFSDFREKIIYIVFDQPPHADAWQNEADTRNAIMRGLINASDNDIILVSDVDEIYNPQIINQINPRHLCTKLIQNFYNYQFNLQVFNSDGSPRLCNLPKAVSYRNLKTFFKSEPETLRNVKKKESRIRKNWLKWTWLKLNTRTIHDAGWHFSWIMSPTRIAEKMSSISHTEYDLPEYNNLQHIKNAIENGLDIWSRERKMVRQEITPEHFPSYIVENKEKYKKFILK